MTEEIDLADSETEVAEAYYPEGVQGNLNLELVNADDLTDAYSDVKSLSDYTVGDKITFKIASDKLSKGKYNAKLTNVDNDNVIVLKETVIEISNLTKDDFNIVYGKDIAVQDEGLVVQLWQIPAKGTIIVSVDGEKRYARDVNKDGSAYVFLDDLKLEDGKQYSIRVAFNTTLGREIELATFDMNASYGSYWYHVYDADVYYGEDFNGYDVAYFASNNRKIVGMLKFYVNNVEKFSHNIVSTDYKLGEDGEGLTYKACPRLTDLGISKEGKYNIRITLNGKELIKSDANVRIRPSVDHPDVMSVGEDQYLTISYKAGSGTAKLYKYIMDEKDYDSKTPVAVFSIKNGKGSYSLSKLPKGVHDFYMKYTIGNENYTTVVFLNVRQNTAPIKASVSPLKITVGKTVTVSLTGEKDPFKAEIYVDGKLLKAVSMKKGKAKVALSDLTVGSHSVRVMFAKGEDNFYSKTFYVTVKPKPIELSLKKVKVKKSAKKLVIKAELKLMGKVAKGKVIKFKFNKKAYKAKTNKKGVAKLTIKKKVLKKLKRGKKITYSATYKTVTKKIKVKVK